MASPTLELHFRPTVSSCISATATGTPREIAVFGTRGDGKTWGAFGAMVAHAQAHHAAGFALPTKWLGAADTFASHTAKTHESLLAPGWRGTWQLRDGGHLAAFRIDGRDLVHLRLFGVEDQSGMDRLRAESHGLWFEEPAPSSVLVQSSGLSETAWALGITSCRLPSHKNPKLMTLNYPDEEHWTWQRFVVRQQEGSAYFRVPPGELASAEQRQEWMTALKDRPDMIRRLLEGKPGVLLLGERVAVGFNEDTHAPRSLALGPVKGASVWIGQDGGLTPTSVIGQRVEGRCRILAALSSEHDGIKQHVQGLLLPWLHEHAPWALEDMGGVRVVYDPAMNKDGEGDTEANALRIMRACLRATYQAGPVNWLPRLNPMLALFNALYLGQPVLQVDPVQARGLVKALNGGWHYPTGTDGRVKRDDPVKNHPHSDYGDAFCYLVAGMGLSRAPGEYKPLTGRSDFSVLDYERPWMRR